MARTVEKLAGGGTYFEGARWHEGRWWVSDIFESTVRTYDTGGRGEDVMRVEHHPSGLGWLPDGSLLVVSMQDRLLLRRDPDGSVSVHADLSSSCKTDLNDMVVDEKGRAFVGTIGFAIAEGEQPRTGPVFRVDPDGTVTVAAEDLWCPNGMVIGTDERTLVIGESFASRLTAFTISDDGSLTDRRVHAQVGEAPAPGSTEDMFAAAALVPDGAAADAEDHVWVADPLRQRCVRISPEGGIVDEVVSPHGQDIFACALGGEDGRTLLLCAAPDFFAAAQGGNRGEGVLLTTRVDVPHGGRP
ncbi:SMP-30/gluconolactonase/LRE family protein [Qaidamihabitans albus]|uniref:SMP-30/gluconolactonase/LRE family protein n=1 Tax=Qaidamihabitans albus TaxID=2795733 RepID=UPI0018F15A19|nr:SMP-30/gluconolactonase/LRE family protein [Qaidamihabitans albus]